MGHTIGIVCSVGVGAARGGRSRNEDNYLVCDGGRVIWREGDSEKSERVEGVGALLAVCDGMGGHRDGEIASTTASRVVAKLYRPAAPANPTRTLRRYVQESHRRLYWRARENGPVTMGTTLTAVWILDGQAAWTHVGDSRLYLYRASRLTQITADHTRNEFARRDRRTVTTDGRHLAQNFIFGSRGLGDDSSLRLESGLDSGTIKLEAGDRLLICTDGLWGSVDDVSMAEVLRNTPDPQPAAVACMERAIARGSTDNITAMVVRIDSVPEVALPPGWDEDEDEEKTGFWG